jgi:hypothetical protein
MFSQAAEMNSGQNQGEEFFATDEKADAHR